eukprot:3283736-Heterocapsa_arctica.AAC.1
MGDEEASPVEPLRSLLVRCLAATASNRGAATRGCCRQLLTEHGRGCAREDGGTHSIPPPHVAFKVL